MIKEITEKFGSFTRQDLKNRFADDPIGFDLFIDEILDYWEFEVRKKYIATKVSIDYGADDCKSVHYNYIPENIPIFLSFDKECCSIIEYGLSILEDGDIIDKYNYLTVVEFDIEDDGSTYEFETMSKEEFKNVWNNTKYWESEFKSDVPRTIQEDLKDRKLEWDFKAVLKDLNSSDATISKKSLEKIIDILLAEEYDN